MIERTANLCEQETIEKFVKVLKASSLKVYHMFGGALELLLDNVIIATNYEEMIFKFEGGLIHASLDGKVDFDSEEDIRRLKLCLYKMVLLDGVIQTSEEAVQSVEADCDESDCDDFTRDLPDDDDDQTDEQKYGATCIVIPLSDLKYEITPFTQSIG